ncbi:MAG: hypothetical protein GXO79_04375 [Chlorobi bacterium]|nr:hypothetical protein [Chlorobiota bacterium]
MALKTNLEPLCVIANSPEELIERITHLMHIEFSDEQIAHRRNILNKNFSNAENANKIVELL